MLYDKNIYCRRKRSLFMSCSELGKEYTSQGDHFKLPYENIPENEQDGITKKSGQESRFDAYPDPPRINWGKNKQTKSPTWIKSVYTLKYKLEDTDNTTCCSQASKREPSLQHPSARHQTRTSILVIPKFQHHWWRCWHQPVYLLIDNLMSPS